MQYTSTVVQIIIIKKVVVKNSAYHFVVDFMKVYLTDFIDNVFALESDEAEASVTVGLLIKH